MTRETASITQQFKIYNPCVGTVYTVIDGRVESGASNFATNKHHSYNPWRI